MASKRKTTKRKTAKVKSKYFYRYRNSMTGEIVTKAFATRHPDVTERERFMRPR